MLCNTKKYRALKFVFCNLLQIVIDRILTQNKKIGNEANKDASSPNDIMLGA